MSTASMTPGSRPRKGLIAAAVALGLAATGLVVVAGDPTAPPRVAGAAELVTFESCADMASWAREAQSSADRGGPTAMFEDVAADSGGAAAPVSANAEAGAASGADRTGGADGTDSTNVAVAGVDELDLVDRLPGGLALVASNARLAIVDLAGAEVVASRAVPYDAQISYDAENAVAWVVGHDPSGSGVAVERVAVTGSELVPEGAWTSSGWLVDARRIDGELHVVATDGFSVSAVPSPRPSAFEETGADPVVEPGSPPPTPTDGGVAGTSTATPGSADDPVTDGPGPGPDREPAVEPGDRGDGDHSTNRDDGLPFQGGPVPCDQVLHPTGPTEPVSTLIATLPATGEVEPVRATEVIGAGEHVHVTPTAAYVSTPDYTGDAVSTGIHRFDLATLTPTGSGLVEGRLLNQFSLSEADGHLRVAVTTGTDVMVGMPAVDVARPGPAPIQGEARNEVVVLDIDGDLDVVGRTARFGKPGESLHGIRFVGDVAYAVTFLQTDPFYVVDLANPTAPTVVGEVELPGFSSYLHPLTDDLVVGFGPGEDGRATAKLFDVSDPTSPQVADSLVLGDEAPVAWDHHAYVELGQGRFAVPTGSWRSTFPARCGPDEQAAARAEVERIEVAMNDVWSTDDPDEAAAAALSRQYDAVVAEGCAYPGSVADSSVVVIDASTGQLVEEDRHTVEAVELATRAIPAGDGWALLAGARIVVLDGSGTLRATLEL